MVRHAQDHGQRQDPALVLTRQHEIDEQQREAEDEIDLRSDRFFLVGHRGPFVARSGRQPLLANLVHDVERLSRTKTWGGVADHRR